MPPQRYTRTSYGSSALPYKFYKDSGWGDEGGYASIRDALEAAVFGTPYLRIGQQRWTQGDPEEYRYFIWRGTCRFSVTDPNITILEVKLELRLDHKQGTGFDIVIRNGMPGYPHYPAVEGDYYRGHYTISEGSINTADWVSGEDRDVIIPNSAIQISTYDEHRDLALGTYMLVSSNDVEGIAPTSYEYLALIRRPRLYLTYSFDLVATTDSVSDITHDGCKVLGSSISYPDDGWTEWGFEYYKEGDEGNVQKKYWTGNIGRYIGFGKWSRLTDLEPGTKYYVRAYLLSEAESCWAYGEWLSFTMLSILPEVTIQIPSDIKATSATANGTITIGDNITERGFEYGLTETATWIEKEIGIDLGLGEYSLPLINL